jgi:hypothetical protein
MDPLVIHQKFFATFPVDPSGPIVTKNFYRALLLFHGLIPRPVYFFFSVRAFCIAKKNETTFFFSVALVQSILNRDLICV